MLIKLDRKNALLHLVQSEIVAVSSSFVYLRGGHKFEINAKEAAAIVEGMTGDRMAEYGADEGKPEEQTTHRVLAIKEPDREAT